MSRMPKVNRRQFLHKALQTSASASVMTNFFGVLHTAQATQLVRDIENASFQTRATEDYKALVCIDLKGGNDGFNMIIPTASGQDETLSYAAYQQARGGVYQRQGNDSGLALPEANILTMQSTDGTQLGVHHQMPEMQQLFNDEKAAVIANVGPLVRPTNKNDYQTKTHLPAHLFSHSDQQVLWLSPRADSSARAGWAGLLADNFSQTNANPDIPMNISAGGENEFQVGESAFPFFVGLTGAVNLRSAPNLAGECQFKHGQCQTFQAQIQATETHPLRQAYAAAFARANKRNNLIDQALQSAAINHSHFDAFWGAFGISDKTTDNFNNLPRIAKELFIIARLISVRGALNVSKQTFYAKMGGFDTHDNLLDGQASLLSDLSKAIGAFQTSLNAMGVADDVTTFTASEFGRTTSSNGDGSDHGWGSHHWVIGGAVKGGKLYGKLPNLSPASNNPDNANWGQIIPTLSADQYAATLCKWFGLSDSDRDNIFPNLQYMTGTIAQSKLAIAAKDLGFMTIA